MFLFIYFNRLLLFLVISMVYSQMETHILSLTQRKHPMDNLVMMSTSGWEPTLLKMKLVLQLTRPSNSMTFWEELQFNTEKFK